VAQVREQGLAESLSKSTEKLRGMEPPGDSADASRPSPSGFSPSAPSRRSPPPGSSLS